MTQRQKVLFVKFGTESLKSGGGLSQSAFNLAAAQIACLMHLGWRVVIVTSGAVQAGREIVGGDTSVSEPTLASIGQLEIMAMWRKAFDKQKRRVAQILVTHANLRSNGERESIRCRMLELLDGGVVPIFNANDPVCAEEIESMDLGFSENDELTLLLVQILGRATVVAFVTESGGVWDGPPGEAGSHLYRELNIHDIPRSVVQCRQTSEAGKGGPGHKVCIGVKCCEFADYVSIIGLSHIEPNITDSLMVGTTFGSKNAFYGDD